MTIVVSDAPRGWTGPEVEAPQGASGQEEVFTFVEAALSGDQAAEVDRLGVAPLADGLARLIMLPQTRPLTVGVQAPWGWGKSSFVAFVREALVRHAPTNLVPTAELVHLEALDALLGGAVDPNEEGTDAEIAAKRRTEAQERRELLQELERRAYTDVICVSFNAWRYEGSEQVWAGLARAITAAMEGTLSRRARLWSRIVYAYRRRKLEFWVGFVAPVVLAVLVAVLAIALGVADAGDTLSGWAGGIAAVLAPAAAFLLIAWRFLHVIQPVSVQVAGYVQGPDYAAHMGYQNEVIDDLKFLHERVEGEPRVVVCVDDLDRCSDESIMETLQAINLVLGASDFFVVLAIDPDMIYRAIARQRGISDDDEAAEVFAENYLRKIIQLPLVLPGRSAEQRFGFVSQLFSPTAQREFRRRRSSQPAGRRASAAGRRRRDAVLVRPGGRHPAARADPARGAGHQGGARGAGGLAPPAARQPARAQAARQRAPARQDPAAAPGRAADRRAAAQAHGLAGVLRREPGRGRRPARAGGRATRRRRGPGHGRRRAPERPRPRPRRHAGARRAHLVARARPAGGYSPAARSGVRSSGSASSISFVKMRSLRL